MKFLITAKALVITLIKLLVITAFKNPFVIIDHPEISYSFKGILMQI